MTIQNSAAILILVIAGALASSAIARDVSEIGDTTHRALELQRSGARAAPVRPVLKDVARRSYERYLDSFTYPIPEHFDRDDSFVANDN